MSILVTGGLGYIGSHICTELLQNGYHVIVIDNLCNSSIDVIEQIKNITGQYIVFKEMDILDQINMRALFSNYNIQYVIHLAGLKVVNESIGLPMEYYNNNIVGTLNLLQVMTDYGCKRIIFSSSASVYGFNEYPISENGEVGRGLTNPYARTKYMIEEVLKDMDNADNEWNMTILRYFNPIGNHPSGLIGDSCKFPTSIFPKLMNSAKTGSIFTIYGDNYETKDGTAIRDYIHVSDLAEVHMIVLQLNNGLHIYNVGTNKGCSVLELINKFMEVNKVTINYQFGKKREGDFACVYANSNKLYNDFGWIPKYGISEMCRDGWTYKKIEK